MNPKHNHSLRDTQYKKVSVGGVGTGEGSVFIQLGWSAIAFQTKIPQLALPVPPRLYPKAHFAYNQAGFSQGKQAFSPQQPPT
jgi:hypothetical protein